jgi:hypothetical protein
MSYANKLSSFEHSFLLRATTAHALRVTIDLRGVAAPTEVAPNALPRVGRGESTVLFILTL